MYATATVFATEKQEKRNETTDMCRLLMKASPGSFWGFQE